MVVAYNFGAIIFFAATIYVLVKRTRKAKCTLCGQSHKNETWYNGLSLCDDCAFYFETEQELTNAPTSYNFH